MTDRRSSRIVLSASRRTDIPAFYMDWFMDRIRRGTFEVTNPYNGRVSIVPVTRDRVHTIVFWSKNFDPFIASGNGESLLKMGYHLFFNFTVNTVAPALEPNVPTLANRIAQLEELCYRFGSDAVNWRFDPICFYLTHGETLQDNLGDFFQIADHAGSIGIKRCITSFMDDYPKIQRRLRSKSNGGNQISFIDPPPEKKVAVLLKMETILTKRNIALLICCENEVYHKLPADSSIQGSSCISNELLVSLSGGSLYLQKDKGQRIKAGCGCQVSVDIGSYRDHPCYHNCLFCYANPKEKQN